MGFGVYPPAYPDAVVYTPGSCQNVFSAPQKQPIPNSALRVLDRENVDVVVSDVSVAGQDVSDFVKVLKAMHPAISTIVTSRSLDSNVAINLINEGQIYRYLKRPVQKGMMRLSLMSAARHVSNVRAVPELQQRHVVEDIGQIRDQSLFRRLVTRYWPFRKGDAPDA